MNDPVPTLNFQGYRKLVYEHLKDWHGPLPTDRQLLRAWNAQMPARKAALHHVRRTPK